MCCFFCDGFVCVQLKILHAHSCDAGYHIDCLTPALSEIPTDDEWFCPDCASQQSGTAEKQHLLATIVSCPVASSSSGGVALRSGHRYIARTEVAERVRARLQDLLNEFDDIITESEEDNSDNDLVIHMTPSNEDDLQPVDRSGDEQADENGEEADANTNAYGMKMSPQSPSVRAAPERKTTPRKTRKTTRRKRKTTRRKRYLVCFMIILLYFYDSYAKHPYTNCIAHYLAKARAPVGVADAVDAQLRHTAYPAM